jgi:hypothetical protein
MGRTGHQHRAVTGRTRTVGWTHCVRSGVDGRACSGVTHGGVVFVDECRCGAVRYVESNAGQTESSGWHIADQQ